MAKRKIWLVEYNDEVIAAYSKRPSKKELIKEFAEDEDDEFFITGPLDDFNIFSVDFIK